MRLRSLLALGVIVVAASFSFSNEKKKPVLPATVLSAQTVSVVIDPNAGVSTDAPLANKTAQDDVEKAFANWGRFKPVMSGMGPDLIVVIRKGNGKVLQPTIHGGGNPNDEPVVIQPTDSGIRIGGQKGKQAGAPQNDPEMSRPTPGASVGGSEDSFAVYNGGTVDFAGDAPIWRYVNKNALHPHDVPAVGEFRKIVEETEKQLQQQQQQQKQTQNKP
jgi:hypothetical protein